MKELFEVLDALKLEADSVLSRLLDTDDESFERQYNKLVYEIMLRERAVLKLVRVEKGL
jgi:hypothetical protein